MDSRSSSQNGTPKQAVDGAPPPPAPSSSATTKSQQKKASDCNACVQLVNSILRDPASRPRQVLQALVGGRATLNRNNQPYPQFQSSISSSSHNPQELPSFRLEAAENGVQIVMRIPDRSVVTKKEPVAEDSDNNNNNNNSNNNPIAQAITPTTIKAPRTFLWSEIEPSLEQQEEEQQRKQTPQSKSFFFSSSSSSSSSTSSPVMALSPLTPTEVVAATTVLGDPSHHHHNNKPTTKYKTETITVECRPCQTTGPEQGARALIMGPTPLSIIACTNRLTPHDRAEMTQILTHELVHAYDVQRLQLNFGDCETAAYSEVRAAREAECYVDPTTTKKSRLPFASPALLTEMCVKQKAIGATQNLFPWKGRGCVGTVFRQAYDDPRPFSKEDVQRWWKSQP